MRIWSMRWFLIMALLVGGCAPLVQGPDVCDTIPTSESWLCAAANNSGVSLGSVSLGIRLANSMATATGQYSRQEALTVLTALEVALDQVITYSDFRGIILKQVAQYPGMIEVGSLVLDTLSIPEIIKPADARILKKWLTLRKKECSL